VKFVATLFTATMFVAPLAAAPAIAEVSASMAKEIPGARDVPAYTPAERAEAAQEAMKLSAPPVLDSAVSLTPNAPFAANGSHLSLWKPSYVIGTASGGEAGVNFWGIYNGGHVNVGYAVKPEKSALLDCRMISSAPVTYKIYAGEGSTPRAEGRLALHDGHFLLTVPPAGAGEAVSVELWPATPTTPVGFFGCELGTYH